MSKGFRWLLKFCRRLALGLLAFIVIYISLAFILSRITVNQETNQGDIAIYINTNGVHTDIVVPVKNSIKDWSTDVLFSHTSSGDSDMKYVAFGWGDKGFYLNTPEWSDLKLSTAMVAAFHLGTSAMHTCYYRDIKEDKDCVKIMITPSDYALLVQYISESFRRDEAGKVQWIKGHHYNNYDAFYEANRKYSLFYTCNTWVNNALKSANLKAALWTLSDTGIFCHYKE